MWLRSRVLAGALGLVLFLLSVGFFHRPHDSYYAGRLASEWTGDLLSTDYKTRTQAQAALAALGAAGVPQIRVLLQTRNLLGESRLVRLTHLLPFLNIHPVDSVLYRQRGAEMIALLGPLGSEAAPDLIDSLAVDQCASDAERALSRCGPAIVPHLTRALSDSRPAVRVRSTKLLVDIPSLPPATVQKLNKLTRDREAVVRRQALHTLGVLNESNSETLKVLFHAADDITPEVRAAALEALSKKAPPENVQPALQKALADNSPLVRLEAAKALWRLSHESTYVVPVLTGVLRTSESWQAAYALAQIGAAAEAAVPELVEALQRERISRPFRTPPSSAFALGQIGTNAIPALRPLLVANDPSIRLNALLAFSFMGPGAKAAVAELLPLLKDINAEVRHITALTLAAIGAEKEQLVPALSACLSAEDIYVRSAAAQVLNQIAPETDWVVPSE